MIAALEHTVRKVNVLAIHEEILVEQAHLIQSLAAQHAVGTAHYLNLAGFIPRQIAHVVFSEKAVVRPSVAEAQHLEERYHRRRQSPSALHGTPSLCPEHPHAHGTRILMDIHEVDARLQRILTHDGIRIEQQYILAPTLPDGDVVGTGKAQIMGAANEANHRKQLLRIALFQIIHRTICRMIIHHDDFRRSVHLLESTEHRADTLVQIILHIVIYYDNREFQCHLNF